MGDERLEEMTVLGRPTKIEEIDVLLEVLKISIAKGDRLTQRVERIIDPIEQGVAASEVVPRERIGLSQLRQAQIDLQALFVQAPPRIGVAEGGQDVEEIWVGAEEFLVEPNFKIKQFLGL